MLRRKQRAAAKPRVLLLRLLDGYADGLAVLAARGEADHLLAEALVEILRGVEAEALALGLLPSRGSQVRDRGLAVAVDDLGDEARVQRVALAGRAGEIEYQPSAHIRDVGAGRRLAQRHVVDRPVRSEFDGR